MNYIYTLKDFRCNKHCPYCITKILNKVVEEDIERLPEYLSELEGDYHYFILSGNGEPSLYSYNNLKFIRDCVVQSGLFKEYRVQTSGLLFNQKNKLSLFEDWIKEITVVSPYPEEDKSFFKYKKDYLQDTYKNKVRCNYTLLLKNFSNKNYIAHVSELVNLYNYVALKILDTDDQWIIDNAVPYSAVNTIISDLKPLLGDPIYDKVGCRYQWATMNGKVTMSYGKEVGHDMIQIDSTGGRK